MPNNKKYEDQLKSRPGFFVEQIVNEVVRKKAVDVHFEEEDDQQWAIIKVYNDEEDHEMAIRLLPGEKWVLEFGFYDDEDEFIELLQPLALPEISLIPPALRKVMLKVLSSEEGLRVPGNVLAR